MHKSYNMPMPTSHGYEHLKGQNKLVWILISAFELEPKAEPKVIVLPRILFFKAPLLQKPNCTLLFRDGRIEAPTSKHLLSVQPS